MKVYATVQEFDDGSIQIAEKDLDFKEWVDGNNEFVNADDFKKELKDALKREFINGNLKHTFNKKLVSDERYVNIFIQNFREEIK